MSSTNPTTPLAYPKPKRAPKVRKRLSRSSSSPRRNRRPRAKGPTIAQKRAQRKAAGPGVDIETWAEICKFYEDSSGTTRCAYDCGRIATEQEHVVPLCKGGQHAPMNVVPSCSQCNAKKGRRTWEVPRRHRFMDIDPAEIAF